MIKRRVFVLCVPTILSIGGALSPGDANAYGESPRLVREATSKTTSALPIPETLDRLVPRLMKSYHVPGVSVAGIENRRIAWDRQYGVRRADRPGKVTRNTVFEAASMTKPVFGYVVLKLVEQGKLDLDRPLVSYLDEPYLADEPLHKRITARMVLSHTTGFPNWRKGGWRKGGKLPVLFEPGTQFRYSGEGFLYLQRVVEHIVRTPMQDYITEQLFKPLGMTISSCQWEDRFDELAAEGHDHKGRLKTNRPLYRWPNAAFSLYCTPSEYASFLVEIMKPDRSAPHSLSAETIDAMFTRTSEATGQKPVKRSGPLASDVVHWGLGWPINKTAGGDRIHHGGSNGTGFRCYCEFDRKRGTGIVIMTNAASGARLWRRVIETVAAP